MFTQDFKKPDFKNKAEENEYKEMAYATYCVNFVNSIKNHLGFIELDTKSFDKESKKEVNVVRYEMLMPKIIRKKEFLKHRLDVNNRKKIEVKT